MGRRLVALLEAAVAEPTQPIGRLELLEPEERHRLLVEWERHGPGSCPALTLPTLFEAQVERSPQGNRGGL